MTGFMKTPFVSALLKGQEQITYANKSETGEECHRPGRESEGGVVVVASEETVGPSCWQFSVSAARVFGTCSAAIAVCIGLWSS